MSKKKKDAIRRVMEGMTASYQISDSYWPCIIDAILDKVAQDVEECADPKEWNEDDVRLAVGRVLCEALGIEI